jgi:YVTN family beta-propeller protein
MSLVGTFCVAGALALLALAAPLESESALTTAGLKATCTVGTDPEYSGYDPVTHEIYVPNELAGNISVLKGMCTLIGTITLPPGSEPFQAAFDPANNDMYVTDLALDQVYQISGLTVTATITGFSIPQGITFDPGDNLLVVTDAGGGYVSFLQGTSVATTDSVGCGPGFIGYDPFFATLLVTNDCSSNVTILNAVTLAHVTDVPVGNGPQQVAFDYADDMDYVANHGSGNVSVLYGSGALVSTISGFFAPVGVGWSQATLHIYVGNEGGGSKVFAISGTAIVAKYATASGALLQGIVYNDANDRMYVGAFGGSALYILS